MNAKQVKLGAATIGAGGLIAMGAVGAAFAEGPGGSETISEGPEITMGETSTSETGDIGIDTSVASPEVTATTPEAP